MTPTNSRVKFKLDTGEYPLWVNNPKMNQRGFMGSRRGYGNGWSFITKPDPATFYGTSFKSIYGLWLEEQMEGSKYLRHEYWCDQASYATYKSSGMSDRLNSKYTLWLEERYINKNR